MPNKINNQLHNQNFKVVEFDHFKMSAGLPSFVLSPGKWIEKTNAIDTHEYLKRAEYMYDAMAKSREIN